MKQSKNAILFYAIGGIIGGGIGFLYWKTIGCVNGCTIWSSWWRSTLAGVVLGGLAGGIVSDFIDSARTKKNTSSPDS